MVGSRDGGDLAVERVSDEILLVVWVASVDVNVVNPFCDPKLTFKFDGVDGSAADWEDKDAGGENLTVFENLNDF